MDFRRLSFRKRLDFGWPTRFVLAMITSALSVRARTRLCLQGDVTLLRHFAGEARVPLEEATSFGELLFRPANGRPKH